MILSRKEGRTAQLRLITTAPVEDRERVLFAEFAASFAGGDGREGQQHDAGDEWRGTGRLEHVAGQVNPVNDRTTTATQPNAPKRAARPVPWGRGRDIDPRAFSSGRNAPVKVSAAS